MFYPAFICLLATSQKKLLNGARCFNAHRGKRRAGAYRGGRPPTACFVFKIQNTILYFVFEILFESIFTPLCTYVL